MKKPASTPLDAHLNWKPRKWIIPPGLVAAFERFDVRCDLLVEKIRNNQNRPLLIHGNTGVGKSMFTDYFVYKFLKQFPCKPVVTINCAAIPEKLLESELFGYKKGAASGADMDKPGYFEVVKDGVIILEELGEMEKNLQAKLLIAIENKIYFRLGDTVAKQFTAQVVATSNASDEKFRDDLLYRFDIFNVPPIHARRGDVLYYINKFDSELIGKLTGGVVLSLLAYNWPGNAREIERVCGHIRENIELISRYAKKVKETHPTQYERVVAENEKAIFSVNEKISKFDLRKLEKFKNDLECKGVIIKHIEDILNSNLLSLSTYGDKLIKNNRNEADIEDRTDGNEYFTFAKNLKFEAAYSGFLVFCKIFFQKHDENYNLLELRNITPYSNDKARNQLHKTTSPYVMAIITFDDLDDYQKLTEELNDASWTLLKSINYSIYLSTMDDVGHWNSIFKMALVQTLRYLTDELDIKENELDNFTEFLCNHRNNGFVLRYFGDEQRELNKEIGIDKISLDDLKELYYETVCHTIGIGHGYQKKLAEIAGRSPGAISIDLKSLGFNKKFNKLNYKPRKRLVVLK